MTDRRAFLFGAGASTATIITGGVVARTVIAAADDGTGSTSADIPVVSDIDLGFCTDMSTHHVQALAMCQRVLGSDTGDAVQAAAAEVLQNQAIEVGMMRAWLTDWRASTAPPTTVMAWMGHGEGLGIPLDEMPGYATAEDLYALATATGLDKGRLWLQLMRAHHVGGVEMAEVAVLLATDPKVTRIAQNQVRSQSFEIEQYDLLLAGTYS